MAKQQAKAEVDTEPIVGAGRTVRRYSERSLPLASIATLVKTYRLGIYDTLDDSAPVKFIGDALTNSADDLQIIRDVISGYNAEVAKRPGCTYAMGVFGVE